MHNNQNFDTAKDSSFEVISPPENTVPKYATSVNFRKLKNGDIVMAFASRSFEKSAATLIETILVDQDHANEIVKVLTNVIAQEHDKHSI